MSHPLIPTPMPVVLSRDAAAEQFGVGSDLHILALRLDPPPPPPPPTTEELAEGARWAAALAADQARDDLAAAFLAVGQCIELVDAHAHAIFEADREVRWGRALMSFGHARDLAFASLGVLYARTPAFLPIGPDVHSNCGDGGDY